MMGSLFWGVGIVIFTVMGIQADCPWKNSPPGPSRSPLVGNLFQLAPQQHETYVKWAKEFGPIMRVDLAETKTVVVNDLAMSSKMFDNPAFQGRLDLSLFDFANDEKVYGVLNTEGQAWEQMRHFAIKHLHELGKSYGKNSTEEIIMQDVNEFIKSLKKDEGKSVGDMKSRYWTSMGNSLWNILTGKRYGHEDAELKDLTSKAMGFKAALEKGSIFLVAPILAKLAPDVSGYSGARQVVDSFGNATKPNISELKKRNVKQMNNQDATFTDMFLKQSKDSQPSSPFYGQSGENHLHGLVADLYFAGSDTISSTMSFMTLYLSQSPDVLSKLQQEIRNITGNMRYSTLADREKMPFTQAVVSETMRLSSIVPLGVQHKATKDMEFESYQIPNGTGLAANLYYIHHNPAIWGDPEKFRPERFLTQGKFQAHKSLIPFSIGYRRCLGEVVAKNALFLYATNVFQAFSVQFDKGEGADNGFEPQFSFIMYPKPFKVVFKSATM